MEDGGPAFPIADVIASNLGGIIDLRNKEIRPTQGMSLRDWFAGMALEGIIAWYGEWKGAPEAAYKLADAMLLAREKCGEVINPALLTIRTKE